MERQVRRFIDEHLQARLKDDDDQDVQVIILAAGYDTLAWRLSAEYPMVNFIEVDHPATGRAKRHALHMTLQQRIATMKYGEKEHGRVYRQTYTFEDCKMPESLYFCHEAVGEKCSLQDALKNNLVNASTLFGYSKEDGVNTNTFSQISSTMYTAVVMEGLVVYLSVEEVIKVFQELGQMFGKGIDRPRHCLLAFNFLTLDDIGKLPKKKNGKSESDIWTSFLRYFVPIFGEPFKWGIAPEDLPDFFKGTGWDIMPAKDAWPESKGKGSEYATLMGSEYETTLTWRGID